MTDTDQTTAMVVTTNSDGQLVAVAPTSSLIHPIELTLINDNAFGGQVYSAPISNLEHYHNNPELIFSTTGKRSFLKSLRIPYSFFNRQPEQVQQDLLTTAKADIKVGNILFLKQNNEVVFCALDQGIHMQDPTVKFPILSSPLWEVRRQDLLYNGNQRYVYRSNDLVKDEYIAAMYVDVPILYAGNIKFEVGMFKVVCSNGMIDRVSADSVSIKPASFSSEVVTPIVDGILGSLGNIALQYTEFLNFLKACPITIAQARECTIDMGVQKVISKPLVIHLLKYFDLANNSKVAVDLLPKEVENMYQFLDALTYYAQKMPSIGVQSNNEAAIFKYFYKKYTEATNKVFDTFSIKELVPVSVSIANPQLDDFVDELEEMPEPLDIENKI